MAFKYLLSERRGPVLLLKLNRPNAMNALSSPLMAELTEALDDAEQDDGVRVIVLTGSDRAFAAGADIKEMAPKSYVSAYKENYITAGWERVASCRKPVIAAVAGYALGGGCELAMMCDFIIAADNARFGQPEITIGVIPGAGGTQRLTRMVGKSKAMDLCLTGRLMEVEEAERCGLVARVVPLANLIDEAVTAATTIAGYSMPTVMMAKDAVNCAHETTLSEGIRVERRLFHSTFATNDQKEGMSAFIEKRKPTFTDS